MFNTISNNYHIFENTNIAIIFICNVIIPFQMIIIKLSPLNI